MAGSALGSAVEHSLHTRGVGGSNPPARTIFLTACALALATAIFYGLALSRQPVVRDEARIVSAAQQPVNGVLIDTGDRWLQPIPVLATKAAHVVRPGFHAGRWASVAISALDVALVFLVTWRLFGSLISAAAAALILLFTPLHMTAGRAGLEAIYVVPFVLGCLLALVWFVEKDRPAAIALASAALGAGVYTTTAAPLTMAFLFVAMLVALWVAGRRKFSTLDAAAGGFVVMLVPLAVWFYLNPQTYPDTYGNWLNLRTAMTAYWAAIDPSFLFLSSERGRAPLHWITAPLILAGVVRCVMKARTAPAVLTLAGTAIAPLGGTVALLPFVTLLAAYAVDWFRELVLGRPAQQDDEDYLTNDPRAN